METLVEYPEKPWTATCEIAWEPPSTWGETTLMAIDTSMDAHASQPLTSANLSRHNTTHPASDGKQVLMHRYQASVRNSSYEQLVTHGNSGFSWSTTMSSLAPAQQQHRDASMFPPPPLSPTKNVAIDAHPLPFPYHNDCTFLPTVETGRTRYDSASTQSLYEELVPSSPTLSGFSLSPHLHPSLIQSQQQYHRKRSPSSPRLQPPFPRRYAASNATRRRDSNASSHIQYVPRRQGSLRSTHKKINHLINDQKRRLSTLLKLDSDEKRQGAVNDVPMATRRVMDLAERPHSPAEAFRDYYRAQHAQSYTTLAPTPPQSASPSSTLYAPSPSCHYQHKRSQKPLVRVEPNVFSRLFSKLWPFKTM
ncbi:hypothetical protein BC940DRAFT_126366 [Gongronella butleri]|nr:hypothetical protein BC940DRAFT_126366 [Gongronella butleri]